MTKYTDEQKTQALQSMKEIGAKKTQELLHISLQTLYKWRSEANTPKDAPKEKKPRAPKTEKVKKAEPAESKPEQTAKALLEESDGRDTEIARLEAENARLREQNDKLRKALAALME